MAGETRASKIPSSNSIAYSKTGTGPALIVVTGATAFRAFDPNLQVQPVLVLNGDASFPLRWRRNCPTRRARTLQGQDHGPKPEVMAPVLREFLDLQLPL
jgi:hypothetical protein